MTKPVSAAMLLVLVGLTACAHANVLSMGPGLTSLETVRVGDPGNASDNRIWNPGFGAVNHDYYIGKYEVTAAQYCEFLNHKASQSDPYGLWNPLMDAAANSSGCNIQRSGTAGAYTYSVSADWANRPVNYVSYWDACRFANWLNNGQGNGSTETGSYTLNGYTGSDGRNIKRKPEAKWSVTSGDEWHKAAYYKGGGTNAGYWIYPTQSDVAPSNVGADGYADPGNHANYSPTFRAYTIGQPYYRTNVGEFENSASPYGTFDQGGNVSEWIEPVIGIDSAGAMRGAFGGSYRSDPRLLQALYQNCNLTNDEQSSVGFRVSFVPEPSGMLVLAAGLASLVAFRRRSLLRQC